MYRQKALREVQYGYRYGWAKGHWKRLQASAKQHTEQESYDWKDGIQQSNGNAHPEVDIGCMMPQWIQKNLLNTHYE